VATDVITIEIRADGSDAAATLQKVSEALKASGDSAEHAKEGFSNVQAAIVTLKEGYELAREAIAKVNDVLLESTLKFAEHVVELSHVAEALNISTQTLNQLNQASYILTGQTDALSTMMLRLERNLGQASAMGGPAARAITDLGLSVEAIIALPADEQFRAIVQGLAQLQDPAERARDAMLLFGRQWQDLIPLMKDGGAGLDDAMKIADTFGLKLKDPVIEQMRNLTESTRELKLMWDTLWGDRSWWISIVQGFENIAGAALSALTEIKLLFTEGVAAAQAYARSYNAATAGAGGHGASGSFGADTGTASMTPDYINLAQTLVAVAANDTAQALQDQTLALRYSENEVHDYGLSADAVAQGMDTLRDASTSAAGLLSELPSILKRGLKAFGIDTEAVGNTLDATAGGLNAQFGTSLTGAGLGAGIGAAFALLMQNPVMQAEVAKLNKLLQDLITPIAEAIAPALDSIAPIMEELRPVFVVIADALRVSLMPLVAEMHALNQVIKPLSDAIERLKNAIESWNPFGGGGGGGGVGGTNITAADIVTGGAAAVFGYADGGMITASRMFGGSGPDGGGLIYAHEGETVVPQGGRGHTFNFNVSAPDARAAGQSIRQIIEELSVRKSFALATGS
jgi:mevalonate kinase